MKMEALRVLLLSFLFIASATSDDCKVSKFPEDFVFGSASAAYQVEGGWNEDGRGPCIWDTLIHENPEIVADRSNADVACDSYHKYQEDVDAIKNIGFESYRFSISWSRIMPTGDPEVINQAGVDYYHRLIDALLKAGIKPVVTMLHFDLPQALQDIGGLANPDINDYFESYATFLFKTYGDKVKTWITHNEPVDICSKAYGIGILPPFIKGHGTAEYLCGHNTLISHAKAYRAYEKNFRKSQGGQVGITLSSRFYYPKTANDVKSVDKALQFTLGWLAHPIFKGGYPQLMVQEVAANSIEEGRNKSRLPEMSEELKNFIHGTADFFALNYYTSNLVEPDPNAANLEGFEKDQGLLTSHDPKWKVAKSPWLFSVPQGFRDLLNWIKNEYNNPEIWITENGWSDEGELDDQDRIEYLRLHLDELLKAKQCDNVNVAAHFTWSIMDNFEWLAGYTEKFGLYRVNFTSPSRERTPKASSVFMKKVIHDRKLPTKQVNDEL